MNLKFLLIQLFVFTSVVTCRAQFEKYSHIYPISEDPNVRWLSNYSSYEKTQFEANPIIKFSFYNNFAKRLADTTKLHSMAQYLDFRPQFRLYKEESQPIKTPSYRIFLGTQHLFRLKTKKANTTQFIGFAYQTGHHSNGQSKCSFADGKFDGGKYCDSIYASITDQTDLSALLNRETGNYSMNLTELTINYRFNKLNADNYAKHTHSVSLGYVINHKGMLGFIDVDLVSAADLDIIGRHRIHVAYDYQLAFRFSKKSKIYQRIRLKQQVEAVLGAHPHINPLRLETSATFYPASTVSALGISFSYIYGHDNYNYRIVDSGSQLAIGLTWDMFPPVKLTN
ncbi:MAG: hypothetical protein K9G41_02125 [Flavobacteriales bacterium]|nr:hypothetical protein [Flavobacteriales bacterium]